MRFILQPCTPGLQAGVRSAWEMTPLQFGLAFRYKDAIMGCYGLMILNSATDKCSRASRDSWYSTDVEDFDWGPCIALTCFLSQIGLFSILSLSFLVSGMSWHSEASLTACYITVWKFVHFTGGPSLPGRHCWVPFVSYSRLSEWSLPLLCLYRQINMRESRDVEMCPPTAGWPFCPIWRKQFISDVTLLSSWSTSVPFLQFIV